MGVSHVTEEILEAWDRGELTPEELSLRYQEHALDLCGTCRGAFANFFGKREATREGRSLKTLSDLLSLRCRRMQELDGAARELVDEWSELSPREREEKIFAADPPVPRILIVEQLLDASHRKASADAEQARGLARLAFHAALRLDPPTALPGLPDELRTRALALEANALRAAGSPAEAGPIMDAALADVEDVEPASRAFVLSLAASLRRAQRRLDEALALSDRAYGLAETLALHELAAQTLIGKSATLSLSGRADEAVKVVRRSLRHVDPASQPDLLLCARHNELLYLVESGEPMEARRLLERLGSLYDQTRSSTVQLRRRWVEARIAHGLGEAEEAEAAFLHVRDGFLEIDNGSNAALVSLDLAVLYADQDRREEMKRLAREMIPIFRAQDVHREALAALLVFWDAAAREAVSHDLLRSLMDYLCQAQNDRDLRFEH